MNECEKHKWEFKGNQKFSSATISSKDTRIHFSIRALYVCTECKKQSKRAPRNDAPWPLPKA